MPPGRYAVRGCGVFVRTSASLPPYARDRQGELFGGAASGGVTGPARKARHDGGGGTLAAWHSSSGDELGRFLRARRTQTSPLSVGPTPGPGVRRTPGLRREELATLAGVSIDYYTRLERGKETRPSPAVVDALARALQLDDAEHQHLRALAVRAARYAPEPVPAPGRTVREAAAGGHAPEPGLRRQPEHGRPRPRPRGLALYAGLADWPEKQRNLARYLFLHPAARDVFPDWENQVRGCVARLRALAGTDPDAPDLTTLVGELLLKSPAFAGLRERHEVTGRKAVTNTFQHPEVGKITRSR